MAKAPPKTRRKMSAVARAELGHPRECDTCGETKEVSLKTYSLSKKGLRGWSTTCRVCQGVAASERLTTLPETKEVNVSRNIDDQDDLINEMYLLNMNGRNPGRLDEVSKQLANEVRRLYGTNRRKSLELFIDITKPLVAGWVEPGAIHDDIKDGLLSDHRRCLIIATRYSAKSTLTSIYVAWEIFLNPLIKIMVVSRGSKLAARMLRTVRKVFIENCPMLRHLIPNDDCLDNAEQFQTPQSLRVTTGGATLTSLGISSNLPGFRADLTIGDDVEGPADDTPEKVMDLEEALNELHMINPRGRKVMLGTYQSEFSVYAKLADLTTADGEPVWELHRALMFEENPDDPKDTRSRWPAMFSDADALDWRYSVTTRAWRLHAMLIADPTILNEKPLKISDLILLQHDPKAAKFPLTVARTTQLAEEMPRWSAPKGDAWYWGKVSGDPIGYASTVVAIDPASGLAARDAIGVAVLGVTTSGFGVIRHLEGVRGATKGENMRRVAEIIRDYKATQVVVEETEEGFFGETLEGELVLVDYPATVEKVKTGQQQKGRRIIEALAPPMGAGRLVMLDAVARSDHGGEFVNQMVRISYDGRTGKARDHDDIVDALAHAVALVKASLVSDIADNISGHHADRLDRLRHIPTRFGGLGGTDIDEFPGTRRVITGSGLGDGMALGELLLEEDEVMISLVSRRDQLQGAVQEDLMMGRQPDQGVVRRIKALTNQIKELKEHRVL